jgi:hypothetical protein
MRLRNRTHEKAQNYYERNIDITLGYMSDPGSDIQLAFFLEW